MYDCWPMTFDPEQPIDEGLPSRADGTPVVDVSGLKVSTDLDADIGRAKRLNRFRHLGLR